MASPEFRRAEAKAKLMSFGKGRSQAHDLWKISRCFLALARERHAEARKLLATGVDPMAQRKAEKTAEKIAVENSFQSITTQWLEHWQEGKSPRHVDSVRRRMASDILPCLGARPIAEIEAPELVAMANAIQDRGARDIAKRALETVGQVFRYGIAHGYANATRPPRFAPATF
jgi:hypothetical protein